jgi:hypothetical protein
VEFESFALAPNVDMLAPSRLALFVVANNFASNDFVYFHAPSADSLNVNN